MIDERDVRRLKRYAKEFATMMEVDEIDGVIADLIQTRTLRERYSPRPRE